MSNEFITVYRAAADICEIINKQADTLPANQRAEFNRLIVNSFQGEEIEVKKPPAFYPIPTFIPCNKKGNPTQTMAEYMTDRLNQYLDVEKQQEHK